MGRLLALFAALIAAIVIAWIGEQPPKPAPASAPATAFSADRAMPDIVAIASVPHAIGSPANHAARDYLMTRMTALRLEPRIHPGVGVYDNGAGGKLFISGGHVENVVGVLPGRDRAAPAVALMAHYDSVPGSPGAADDAAGVATALETVRALKARGTPARDVIVLLTDGEEAGLLGADAFYNRDPLARHVGFIFNLEARGAAGRVQMFQAGLGDGASIDVLRRATHDPHATSLTGFIYVHMPNDTDFTVSRKEGIAGFNYGFLGHQFEYHSPTSTPATLDQGTLQDMGQQVLGSAQALSGARALPAKTADTLYGQIPGGLTLTYLPVMGWLVLGVSALLIVVAVTRARRLEAFPWTDVLRGMGAALFAVIGGGALLHFARLATGAPFGFLEQRFLLAQADRWETAVMLLALGFLIFAAAELARGRRFIALLPLAAGLGSCGLVAMNHAGLDRIGLGMGVIAALLALVSYGRPVSRAGAWTGVLVLGLVAAMAAQIFAPVAAFVIAWPLILGAAAAAIGSLSARKGMTGLVVTAIAAAIGLGWIGGLAHGFYLALDQVEILCLLMLLAALLLWPLAQPDEGAPPARLVGPILLIAGLAVLVAVRVAHPYDARHPRATYVGYFVDQDTGKAWRFSRSPDFTPWAASVLTADGGKVAKLSHWSFRQPVDAAPAPALSSPAPQISLARQADGTLLLHAVPPAGARTLLLTLKPNTAATIEQLSGAPRHLAMKPGVETVLRWAAAPEGVDVLIRPGGPGRLELGYVATTETWPAGLKSLPKRPADLMGFDNSDSASVVGRRSFSW